MQMTCFFSENISSGSDFVEPQGDIDQIYDWSTANLMHVTLNLMKTNCKMKSLANSVLHSTAQVKFSADKSLQPTSAVQARVFN